MKQQISFLEVSTRCFRRSLTRFQCAERICYISTAMYGIVFAFQHTGYRNNMSVDNNNIENLLQWVVVWLCYLMLPGLIQKKV